MARVRVQLETPDGQHHFPPGTYSIGRADDCDVVLSSGRCSRYHARLVVDAQGAALEDLGSANGTFVNGVRIAERHALNNGDFVVVGGELGLEVSIETEISISDTTPRRPGPSRTEGQAPYLPPTARVPMDEVLEAAADLGCRPTRAFFRITLPLSMSGIVAGSMLVFIPAVAGSATLSQVQ